MGPSFQPGPYEMLKLRAGSRKSTQSRVRVKHVSLPKLLGPQASTHLNSPSATNRSG